MSREIPQWVRDLEAQPCECTRCGDCGGSGYVDDWRYGMHELETCEECRGSGFVDTCERCQSLYEYEEDEAGQ